MTPCNRTILRTHLVRFAIPLVIAVDASAAIRYVDTNAPANGNGTSWSSPYKTLQAALVDAQTTEIHIADGTYYPTDGAGQAATFKLMKQNLVIKGGYPGYNQPDVQDIDAYQTILSGDLQKNDLPFFINTGENAFHVVSVPAGANIGFAELEGLTITAGNANGIDGNSQGGGLYVDPSSIGLVIVDRCTVTLNQAVDDGGGVFRSMGAAAQFQDSTISWNVADDRGGGVCGDCFYNSTVIHSNSARYGGAICSLPAFEALVGCDLLFNYASEDGGAIYDPGDAIITGPCVFKGNIARMRGGAIWSQDHSALFVDCDFIENSVIEEQPTQGNVDKTIGCGGAIFYKSTTSAANGPIMFDCCFAGNSASECGGAICSSTEGSASPAAGILMQCRLIGNVAESGGAMHLESGEESLANCLFASNMASTAGDAVFVTGSSTCEFMNCTFAELGANGVNLNSGVPMLANCIFDSELEGVTNADVIVVGTMATPVFSYVCIPSLLDAQSMSVGPEAEAIGLLVGKPSFENAGKGPDGILGSFDDEYQLALGSLCVDAGNNFAVPPFITTDLAHNARFADDSSVTDLGRGPAPVVDMGAYEAFPDCNDNGCPDACDVDCGAVGCQGKGSGACETCGLSMDCNVNGVPDECEPDCNNDGIPDACQPGEDENRNGIPDYCDPDCNGNGHPDDLDPDGDMDGIPDDCEGLFTITGATVIGSSSTAGGLVAIQGGGLENATSVKFVAGGYESAFGSPHQQQGASPCRAHALQPVTEGNGVAARRGREQLEVNDRSAG